MKYSDDTLIRLAQKFICDLDQVKLLCARGAYDDIIDLPHHVSTTRPQMSRLDRAAQFAPFATYKA